MIGGWRRPATGSVLALALAVAAASPATAGFLDSVNPFADTKDEFEGKFVETLDPGPWPSPAERFDLSAGGGGVALKSRRGEEDYESSKDDEKVAEEAEEPEPIRVPNGLTSLRMAEDSVAYVPALAAYINRIGARVLAGAPITGAPVKFYVTANEDFGAAKAFPDGAVGIPVGLLRAVDSEDELAFVLGHEAGHVLLGHHDLDWIKSFNGKLVSAAEITLAMGVTAGQKLGRNDLAQGAGKVALIAQAFWFVSDKGLFPSFTREQEDEADLIGLDLMIRAGYNPDGGFSALNQLEAWEKAVADRPSPLAQKRAALEREANESMQQGDVAGAVGGFFESLALAGKGLVDDVSVTHRSATERYESLLDYFLREYVELESGDLRYAEIKAARERPETVALFNSYENARAAIRKANSGELGEAEGFAKKAVAGSFSNDALARYAFAATRMKQGRTDKAMQNLEIAKTSPQASLIVYQKLAELQWVSGKRQDSVVLLESALDDFDEPPELYADIVYRYHALGDQKKADQLALKCKLSNRAAGELCLKAAKGEMPTIGG